MIPNSGSGHHEVGDCDMDAYRCQEPLSDNDKHPCSAANLAISTLPWPQLPGHRRGAGPSGEFPAGTGGATTVPGSCHRSSVHLTEHSRRHTLHRIVPIVNAATGGIRHQSASLWRPVLQRPWLSRMTKVQATSTHDRKGSSSDGREPVQALETGDAAVGGGQPAAVGQCQGSQPGVGHEVAPDLRVGSDDRREV